ncbi:MAG: hypothetical protein ABW221_26765 [Vicinamibacteria bacterium]
MLRGIADALDGHAHSWGRARKVGSLSYCAAEVDAARDRWERALAGGGEPDADPASRLAELAAAFEESALPQAGPLAAELRDPARGALPRRVLEPWLMEREAALVADLCAHGGAEWTARIETAVDADLAAYRGRMPERVLKQVRTEAIARRVTSAHGLPRLTLFAL